MTNIVIATSIVERLQNLGYTAYFAGGWVRDYLLNFPSDDIDIATNASIEVLQTIFPKTISVGVSFGIIIVVEEGHQFEVATFRKESDYVDGRRPSNIEPCSPQEDAKRRDFTINGLFYDPIKKQIYDYVDGQIDLKNGLLKAIGNPFDRFNEDRLRMLRAIRYSTRFGFQIETKTKQAIKDLANHLFPAVSKERIYQEFQKMDLYDTLGDSLTLLLNHHLLKVIFRELSHIEDSHIIEQVNKIKYLPKNTPLIAKLSLLFEYNTLSDKLKTLEQLKISKKESLLIEYLDKLKNFFTKGLTDYELCVIYADEFFDYGINFFKHQKEFKKDAIHHEKYASGLKVFVDRIKKKNPLITSAMLIALGIPKGRLLGQLLKEAEQISVNMKILDADKVIKKLKTSANWPFKLDLESN